MITNCYYCGVEFDMPKNYYNRAKKAGLNVYCSKAHAHLGKRVNKSEEQKKFEKSEYDRKYRELNYERLKKEKHEYFNKDYAANPEKYKKQRQEKYPKHLEYLNTDKYKNYKSEYDKKYRAQKQFGEYWEAGLILIEIEKNLESKQIKYAQGITQNKSTQKRKRLWKNLMQQI